ncbi:MAG: T9SS type A sorting domain-containing protein [Bacteroidetes bacterium]|nr:T9SS type A sorting domain-containing protein [Bacteroidota bacterium]
MKKIFYNLFFSCLIALLAIPGYAQQQDITVLYVKNADPAVGGDTLIIDSLKAMGYQVFPLLSSIYDEFSHSLYGADVIVFGEALSSSRVTPFANAGFPTPTVSFEGFCVRENRWALGFDSLFWQIGTEAVPTEYDPEKHYGLKIVADHPITNYAGLTVDDEVLWSSQTDTALYPPQVTYFDLPQAAATVVADIKGETDFHTLYAIEPDSTDATNPLQHRAVIWGVHENGLIAPEDVFFDILDGAILWVMGQNTTAVNPLFDEDARLNAQPNPFTDFTQINFNLKKAGQVSLEVYDIAGRKVAQESGLFDRGEQRLNFNRPANMPAGMYHFMLRLDGKVFGSGKMVAN